MTTNAVLLSLLAGSLLIILVLVAALVTIVLHVLSRLLPNETAPAGPKPDLLKRLGSELSRHAEKLRDATVGVDGDAKQESEQLIAKAERLTTELSQTKDYDQARPLMSEGADVMSELERLTQELAVAAKDNSQENL